MSSKWHESIGEERRQADLTAQALGQQDETCAEADAELTPGGKHHQHVEDIREFAREVSTALIEPPHEPNTDLRKKIQQHFDEQKPSHTRRYAEMTSNKTTLLKSRTLWFMLAGCALVAAVPLGMHWLTDHRKSQPLFTVADNTVREMAREGLAKMESADVQEELAQLVGQFNELMDENRYAEARVIARQAKELAPDEPVTETLVWKSKFVGRLYRQTNIRDGSESAFVDTMTSVIESRVPFGNDYNSFRHGDASEWRHLSEAKIQNMEINKGWDSGPSRFFGLSADGEPTAGLDLSFLQRRPSNPYRVSSDVVHNANFGTERYEPIVENPFRSPAETQYAKSTFSIDVDTASYANVRRFLNQGTLPPPGAVRIEEMINYFDYDYPQPEGNKPFSVSMEVAECPWQPGHQLVRIGLKGKTIDSAERRPCNLVFLLDVSGSMSDHDKLPLLKRGLQMMLGQLTESDRVTIVTYAGDAGLKLEATSGDQTKKIAAAIDSLQAGGSTNGSAGIQLAYKQAQQHFIKDGNNRVILATDGDLNVGVTDDNELVELIRKKAANGVFLTVLGFGTGNLQDAKLEKLADNGNGMYAYIDNLREARKVLVEQAMGTLVTIAKDVKIQVEFNPVEVASYRLIGYENRALANQDFNNDKRDAGDIGAGHTVTALYEIVPTKQADQPLANADEPLKYQRPKKQTVVRASFTEAAGSGELLTVWVRYKEPDGHESKKLEFVVKVSETKFNRSSKDLQFAASVAAFGMLLRNSEHCGNMTFAAIEETAAGALGSDPKGHRTALLDLVRRASSLRPESGSIDQR